MKRKFPFNPFYTAKAATTAVTTQGQTNGGTLFDDLTRVVYSKEIEFHALPLMVFQQFATVKTELGIQPGLTISMMTYDNIALGGALEELKPMTTQALSGSLRQLTVTEYGNAMSFSELSIQSSFDDVLEVATTLLGRDHAMVVDCALRDAALSGTNKVFAAKSDGTAVTSRANLDATCTLKVSTIKDALEILATNNAPMYRGQYWICIVHPHQSRNLRDTPEWINRSNFSQPELMLNGSIGRIDNVIFVETTLMKNGAAATDNPAYDASLKAGTVPVYQAVLFGDAYYGIAYSLPVELRDDGVKDFGRERSLGWYSIFGVGKLHDKYGIVIETA